MKALVTGGAGFIGSHLAARLISDGHSVRVVDDLSTGRVEVLPRGAEFVKGSITDPRIMQPAARDIDVIFHLAARVGVGQSFDEPAATMDTNVSGTANVLDAARLAEVRRLVFSSSSAVYGDAGTLPIREEQPTRPVSLYGSSKLSGEMLCPLYSQRFGIETVRLRYFNVYGRGQRSDGPYAAVIPRFVEALTEGREPEIYGDGHQVRDFIFVDDVVQANLAAARAIPPRGLGRAYNVGSGTPTSIIELLNTISHLLGIPARPRFTAPRIGDIAFSVADISAMAEMLGLAAVTPLADGLANTLGLRSGSSAVPPNKAAP